MQARTDVLMGTLVTMQIAGADAAAARAECDASFDRAFQWFRCIETCCSRFDPTSELMQLTTRVGEAVPVSTILLHAIHFALSVAEESGGAFDPTIGLHMERRGFNRDYRTGACQTTAVDSSPLINYRDVHVDRDRGTVTLLRPLVLDLGAVAKGLAVDMAARELEPHRHFLIDAGGDVFAGGTRPDGRPWSVGIRHPRNPDVLIDRVRVADRAVCTSGDYERRAPDAAKGHHLLDARSGEAAAGAASVTVIAPTAMLADAIGTAAFALGPAEGLALVERVGVDALIVSPTLERLATQGMSRDYKLGEILQDAERHSHNPAVDPDRGGRAGGGPRPHRARTD